MLAALAIAATWLSYLATEAAKWIATKAMLTILIMTVLPIVLNNVIYAVINSALNMVAAQAGGLVSPTVAVSGVAAWIAVQTRLPECMSLILAALAKRVAFRMIPFVGLK